VQSKYATNPMSSLIPPEQVRQIRDMDEVKSQIPIVLGRKRFENRDVVYLFGISGIARIADKLGISLVEGKLYHPASNEVLAAQRVLKSQQLKLGEDLIFPGQPPLKIVGSFHSWISFFNSSVICDLDCARRLLHKSDKTNMLFLSLHNPRDAEKVVAKISQKYPTLLPIISGEFSGAGMVKNLFYLSDIIALTTLLIASVILINTFLIEVHERKREIGILHAIGWHKAMIVYMFVIESLVLTISGGLIGFICSIAFLQYLQSAYQQIQIYLPENLDASLFLYSLFICILIAIISVVIPAYHATRLVIVRALNNE
jgi:putative ABC transport system permease protein